MVMLRRTLAAVRRAIDAVTFLLSVIAGIILTGLMGMMVLDVTLRNTTGRPLSGLVDWIELLLVLIVFLGIAEAQRNRDHVAIDVIADAFPQRLRIASHIIGGVVGLLVVAVIAYVSTRQAIQSYAVREFRRGLAEVPLWPGRIVLAVGFVLFALQIITTTAQRVRERPGASEPFVTAEGARE